MSFQRDPFRPPGGLTHITHSVFWSILPEILFFSAVAAATGLITDHVHDITLPVTILGLFGTVLGFLISFRTSSALERFGQGRQYWSQITLSGRNFARLVWLHTPLATSVHPAGAVVPEAEVTKALLEKRMACNLAIAFAIALKHYLRGEAGVNYVDLYPYTNFLPRYLLPSSNELIQRTDLEVPETGSPEDTVKGAPGDALCTDKHLAAKPQLRSRNTTGSTFLMGDENVRLVPSGTLLPSKNPPPETIGDYIPIYPILHDIFTLFSRKARKLKQELKNEGRGGRRGRRKRPPLNENVPLEITLLMSGYVAMLQSRKVLDPPTITSFLNTVQSFADALTGLERILLTPIPIGYSLQLRHAAWLFLFFLSAQIYAVYGYVCIAATAIATFLFLGFLELGEEVQNPFGYDSNDLDVDGFTAVIKREIEELTAHPPATSSPDTWMWCESNLPFGRAVHNKDGEVEFEGRSAAQMLRTDISLAELTELLRTNGVPPEADLEEVITVQTTHTSRSRRPVTPGFIPH